MSCSESRTHIIKPLVIKAAIPAALSAAAYICAKIISKRSDSQQTLFQPENDSLHSSNPPFHDYPESENHLPYSEGHGGANLINGQIATLQEKLLELEVQIEVLQKRACDSNSRFLRYRGLKEREIMLTYVRNSIMLEKAQAEFLLKEISMMEEETKSVGELVIECIKHMEEMQRLKRENGFLQRKARKSWRREKYRLRVLRKQKLRIEATEFELLTNNKHIQKQDILVQELERQVAEMKGAIDHLQREKIELFHRVEFEQKMLDSTNSEIEKEVTEKYEKVLKELDQLKKDKEEEAKELAYLKWSNACLRHELLRHQESENMQNGEHASMTIQENLIHDCNTVKHEEVEQCNCVGSDTSNGQVIHSRRHRLVQKLKRWVDGERAGKSDIKRIGWNSIGEEAKDQFVPPRTSCSSV